ncbi:hypothetical protein evm_001473 [Chilo suppressalis]|nr:hypothetical protein evm_001473 [Chilo suppressalis]
MRTLVVLILMAFLCLQVDADWDRNNKDDKIALQVAVLSMVGMKLDKNNNNGGVPLGKAQKILAAFPL